MYQVNGYGTHSAKEALAPFTFERREVGAKDVQIEILFCGVCHSDLHTARNEWQNTVYPVVPGHEIVGRVTAVGADVKSFKVGDLAGVGCLSDSCRVCPDCADGLEQYCDQEIFTYNSPDRYTGKMTYGGYSNQIVTDEHFVLRIPAKLDLAAVAPLLCAGITTYSPLRHWNVGTGSKVEDAKRLGAHEVVISKNPDEMKQHLKSFDFILNTVAASHNLDIFTELLKRDGTMCLNGVPEFPHPSPSIFNLIFKRRQIAGSLIGGIKETQEMLDFCAEHNITSDIEIIAIKDINQAYERMLKGDVKYRFVIDMTTLKT
jgi:alcohol dehydrogenase (NADP+)